MYVRVNLKITRLLQKKNETGSFNEYAHIKKSKKNNVYLYIGIS